MKYVHRPDIVGRKTLEQNFKTKFETLNRVHLSDSEFLRLREEIIASDVFEVSTFCEKGNIPRFFFEKL